VRITCGYNLRGVDALEMLKVIVLLFIHCDFLDGDLNWKLFVNYPNPPIRHLGWLVGVRRTLHFLVGVAF